MTLTHWDAIASLHANSQWLAKHLHHRWSAVGKYRIAKEPTVLTGEEAPMIIEKFHLQDMYHAKPPDD